MRALAAGLVAWAFVAAPLSAQNELFQQGNQRYQDGDWSGAAEAYEAVLDAGYESGDLHYNLGNAYFKRGDLGLAILAWERARLRAPSDPDVIANLELARSLTVDAIEPLPTFWVVSVFEWWVGWLPRGLLVLGAAIGWLCLGAGAVAAILLSDRSGVTWSRRVAWAGGVVALLLGANLGARELGVGQPERGVVLVEAVSVRSAPSEDDNLTLFEVHEGTRVRIDGRAGDWLEIVLDDGKVGWVSAEALERI